MKIQEVIKELKSYADSSWGGLNEAFEMAINALEKQTPKKPIINRRKIQCVNGHNQPIQHYKYCPMCGQLIDYTDLSTKKGD